MTSEVDAKLLFWAIWGIGTPVVYLALLVRKVRQYRRHKDPSKNRDAVQALGLFLVSLAASLGISFGLLAPGTGVGRLLYAIASGAFLIVGVYMLMESEPDDPANERARRQ